MRLFDGMGFFVPPPPPPQSECVVCMESVPSGRGLLCHRRGGGEHFLCDGCFDRYVAEQGKRLRDVVPLAEAADHARRDQAAATERNDVAAAAAATRHLAFLHGRVTVLPDAGLQCGALP
eukprot:194300-Prymnesium_polylepis.1